MALAAAPMCAELFTQPSQSIQSESQTETRFSFLPEHIRLVRKSKNEYFADYVYSVNGYPRLKSSELTMDFANVIDANLNSGRELLNAIFNNRKEGKASGAFIFIDVNNLGWVNKNFAEKSQAGDLYLFKTVDAIQKVVGKDGLVFRLGGDEFGIVIEAQEPEAIQLTMKNLQREIHVQAHSVFLQETRRRVTEFKEVHQKRKAGLITELEYQRFFLQFKNYTSYSQEGVSMGAAYLDGSSAEVIQHRAEKMATEMKIKIKQAFNLDTSKYTGGVNLSNSENKIKPEFRPEIPAIMSLQNYNKTFPAAQKTDTTQLKHRAVWFSSVPALKSQRIQEVLRLGQLGIGKYKNELKAEEYRLEYYNIDQQITETRPIETNNNTGFMDARSHTAKVVINHFLERVAKPTHAGGTIWVSLLNLGKLNYFHQKTATGDKALGLAAEAIKKELVGAHVPFKHNGSDFFILSVGTTKEQIADYKKVLEERLNSNAGLNEIFLQEIDYIEKTEQDPQARSARIEEVRKLMAHKFKVF
ncbi:diguanylate cyclase domain-containing protein [Pseudobdellovibrio sp. HCB154]|uniref:diguanylate cyclase domain-containing protein n=1 Tax=Pseudobdellovibrio sp. HCB154 TaxID=3386277 RepID=UPI003916EF62